MKTVIPNKAMNRFVACAAVLILLAVNFGRSAAQENVQLTAGVPVAPQEFNGDLRTLPQIKSTTKNQVRPLLLPHNLGSKKQPASNQAAPLIGSQAPTQNMPSPSTSFKGLDFAKWGAGWPPDTNGDVGPNYYIQTVNISIGIYNKTGTQLAALTFDTLWSGVGSTPCNGSNQGDPVVLYDPLADRWIITDFAFTDAVNGPFYECFAASKTSNPVSGGWWFYAIRTDFASPSLFADYPKLGIWPDGIYMSANMFDSGNNNAGVRVWAFNRSQMESGATIQSIIGDLSTNYFGLLPSNLRGSQPPSGTPNYFVANCCDPNLDVWKFHVDWVTTTNSTFTGPTSVTQANYTPPPAKVPQPTGDALDTLFDRLMMQNQYRNIGGTESLWLSHTVGSVSGVTGIHWYQLNVTGGTIASSPVQESTYQPDSINRWLPSLAVDKQGNMAIGYSVSSASTYPGIRYVGRLASDALNTLGQGETILIAGTGAQSGGFGRWGDYSAMTVDPVDDCTFWYTNEYYDTTGNNWQTRIGSFKFPGCIPAPPAATLVSPTGNIGTNYSPTYTWNQVTGSSYYRLSVDGPSGNLLYQWYTSAQTNCNGLTCSIAPALTLSGGAYTWKIQTWSPAGAGPWSTPMSFSTTVIGIPGAATLSSPTGNIGTNYSPTYTWNQVTGSSYYRLSVDGPSGNLLYQWYTSAQTNCNGSTCSIAPALTLSGGAYTWKIQTWSPAGAGPWSTPMSFSTTVIGVPGAATLSSPTGNIGTNYSPTYTWNQVTGSSYYRLSVDGPSGNLLYQWYTSAQTNCNGTTCSIAPTVTLAGGAYTWKIQTWSPAGAGPWSSTMSFSTTVVGVPGAATLTSPTGNIGTNYSPTYTWNQVTGSSYYRLSVDGPSGNLLYQWYTSAQANCNGTTCSIAPSLTLAGGVAYTWKIQTWSPAGAGPWSSTMSFNTTLPPVPGAATLASPIGNIGTNHSPTYTWNQVTGSSYYRLSVDGPSGNLLYQWYMSVETNCNGTTCSITPALTLAGGAYTWKIQTWSPGGAGPWSSTMSFTVGP